VEGEPAHALLLPHLVCIVQTLATVKINYLPRGWGSEAETISFDFLGHQFKIEYKYNIRKSKRCSLYTVIMRNENFLLI
jgi:hypothetical protein